MFGLSRYSRLYTSNHLWCLPLETGAFRVGLTDYWRERVGTIRSFNLDRFEGVVGMEDALLDIEGSKDTVTVGPPVCGVLIDINHEIFVDPATFNYDLNASLIYCIQPWRTLWMTKNEYDLYCRQI